MFDSCRCIAPYTHNTILWQSVSIPYSTHNTNNKKLNRIRIPIHTICENSRERHKKISLDFCRNAIFTADRKRESQRDRKVCSVKWVNWKDFTIQSRTHLLESRTKKWLSILTFQYRGNASSNKYTYIAQFCEIEIESESYYRVPGWMRGKEWKYISAVQYLHTYNLS